MEQHHSNDCNTDMEIDYNEEQMIMDDEEYARQLQQEYIKEALLEQQQEEEHKRELRRLENEENARIRIQQDMEYLECLNVIPKNNIAFQNNEDIPHSTQPIGDNEIEELPDKENITQPAIIKPPQHFICPISNKIIEIPIRDIEDNIYYDKKSLLQYLKENNNKNHNGKIIDKQNLMTDNNLKTEIFLWLREHPEYNNFQ